MSKTGVETALHVRTWGPDAGDMVLLVHAGIAESGAWSPVAERLAESGLRCIAPDLRGFGSSPDPAGDFRHADDLLAVMDALVPEQPCALVGWSMGGSVALELAVDHPDRISALGLVCSVPAGFERSAFVVESWARERRLLEAGDLDGAIANDIATWGAGPRRTASDLDPGLVAYLSRVTRDLIDRDGRGFGESLDGDRDAGARISTFDRPVLVAVADLDTTCHLDAARQLCASAPDARIVTIADAAHMAPMEQPDAVAQLVLALSRP